MSAISSELKIAASVVIYCISVSAIPIFNKLVFSGGLGVSKFPYPVATAFLQLGVVGITLCMFSVAMHLYRSCIHRCRNDLQPAVLTKSQSWVFGPEFSYKFRHAAPIGALFGLKYGITNLGLHLVPTGTHLLLQTTDLVWTLLLARLINKEKLGVSESCAAGLTTIGAVLIGWNAVSNLNLPLIAVIVNIVTPFMLALCIVELRRGTAELLRPDNRLEGTMSPIEFTAIKLVVSSLVALILASILENGVVNATWIDNGSWWNALASFPFESLAIMFAGGGLFVLIFQVNITWLAALTSATTVGIVGEVKVVPQWALNSLFQLHVDLKLVNILGAAFSLLGSASYAYASSQPHRWICTRDGLKKIPRSQPATKARGISGDTLDDLDNLRSNYRTPLLDS